MARARPLDPDQRRAQLLATARRVFAEKGFHGASVSDIIEAAGVARGTFYNYFESKRAVFQAVLDDLIATIGEVIEPIDVTKPIAPQVRDDIDRVMAVLTSMGGGVRILFTDAAGVDEESADALREFYAAAEERLARALTTGQRLGIVRDGDAGMMAVLLIGMLREPVVQAWLQQRPLDVERLVDELFRTVATGVVRTGP